LDLQHAALVAFGATRKAGTSAAEDPQVLALLASQAPVVTLVAKSDRRHIERALRTDVAENCAMVADTVAFLRGEGRRVFLDAEHFFDGFAFDPDTALRVLDAAVTAGADVAVLCDTNGGMLPLGIAEVVTEVAARTGFRLGIHCQDDTGCAVANSVAAVQAGATHVQCTANGYGERAGNADLFAVVGNLVTKLGLPVLPDGRLGDLTRTSHALAEIANIAPDTHQAYVGTSAFAHKAGLHASAIKVDPELYNHMNPVDVGNGQRVLVTGDGGPGQRRAQGNRARPGPGRPPRRGVVGGRDGQGAGGHGLVVRGRRRLAGAADAFGVGGDGDRAVRARLVPGDHRAPGRRARGGGGDGQGRRRRAAGAVDGRGQRAGQRAGTRRCGPRWSRRARGWPTSRCRTTRCGSSRGAPTP
jgi:hypothetical protein